MVIAIQNTTQVDTTNGSPEKVGYLGIGHIITTGVGPDTVVGTKGDTNIERKESGFLPGIEIIEIEGIASLDLSPLPAAITTTATLGNLVSNLRECLISQNKYRSWHFSPLVALRSRAKALQALAPRPRLAKGEKGRCPKGFSPDGSDAALAAWGIAIPWIPRHAQAWRQTHLVRNDTYPDLLNTLLDQNEAMLKRHRLFSSDSKASAQN